MNEHEPRLTKVTKHYKKVMMGIFVTYVGFVRVTNYTGDKKASYTYDKGPRRCTPEDAKLDAEEIYNRMM